MILIKEIGLKPPTRSKYGLFKCVCGKEFETQISRVKNGYTKSCGCLKNKKSSERMKKYNTKHNGTGTRLHNVWLAMKKRCNKNVGYKNVNVCDDWKKDYQNFREWSYSNGYSESLTIDRKDTYGNYEPDNCRWVDMKTQAQNRGKKKGVYSSQFKGVYFDKKSKKFRANITVSGTRFNLGLFIEEEEAKEAYNKFVNDNNLKHRLS